MIIPISRMRKPWHRKVESKVQHVVNGEPDSDPDSPSSSVGLAHSKPLDSEASRLTSESISCSAVSDYLRPHGLQPTRRLCPWASPGKNTGVGCRFLLQGIFLTQGLNLGLQHCRQILYHLNHQISQFYIQQGVCFNPKLLIYPPHTPPSLLSLLVTMFFLFVCFCFVNKFLCIILFLKFHMQLILYDICLLVSELINPAWSFPALLKFSIRMNS